MALPTSAPGHRQALYAAIRSAWTAQTSFYASWSEDAPSAGQCAVTALVLQDYLGGELMRAENGEAVHYWNVIDGEAMDLTRDQFVSWYPVNVTVGHRSDMLLSRKTVERYQMLYDRVESRCGPPSGIRHGQRPNSLAAQAAATDCREPAHA